MQMLRFYWAAILVFCCSFAMNVAADEGESEGFTFDTSKYAQVHLKMTGGGNPFTSKCPNKEAKIFNVSFKDFFKGGKQVASLTVELNFPDARPAQLFELIKIERGKRRLGSRKCSISIYNIDQLSPLFSMSNHQDDKFKVTVKLHQREKGQDVFSNTIEDVQAASSLVPKLPSGALTMINTILPSLKEIGGYEGAVHHHKDLLIHSNSNNSNVRKWTIPSFDESIKVPIVFTASLVARDSLYGVNTESTNPGRVLARPFAAGQEDADVEGFLLAKAASEYSNFQSVSSVEQANGACNSLFKKVDKMGLTSSDSAVLKWALLRAHPNVNLSTNHEMDRLNCTKGLWGSLPKNADGTSPAAFLKRKPPPPPPPVVPILPPPPEMKTPNYMEMREAVGQGYNAAAIFFKTADRRVRQKLGGKIFAAKFKVTEMKGINLLSEVSSEPMSVSDMILKQWNIDSPLAENFGCLAWSEKAPYDVPEGQLWAIGNFLVGNNRQQREAIVKFEFPQIEVGVPAHVKVSAITLSDPSKEDLAVFQARFPGKSCYGGWGPNMLK